MSEVEARKRLHRLLERDLGPAVRKSGAGTWTTTSGLPHDIRLHRQAVMTLVRVSAGMVVGVKPTKALLKDLNLLNVARAFTRRVVGDGNVLVVAEMPVASLRKGDLEHLVSMVCSFARMDAPAIALHGGRSVTDPPPALAPDLDRKLTCWGDVLRASRTATLREMVVWIDMTLGCDSFIHLEDDSVIVTVGRVGIGNEFPFRLSELLANAEELQEAEDDDEY